MEWLAVRFHQDWFLFPQHRSEREVSNSVHRYMERVINTIVIRTFETELEAQKYCKTINEISELLNKI